MKLPRRIVDEKNREWTVVTLDEGAKFKPARILFLCGSDYRTTISPISDPSRLSDSKLKALLWGAMPHAPEHTGARRWWNALLHSA